MKYILIFFCFITFTANAQTISPKDSAVLQAIKEASIIHSADADIWKPDTALVVRIISNETPSTWWRQIDHSPFPCRLKEIRIVNQPYRYLKKLRHGWAPLPIYYHVWNN